MTKALFMILLMWVAGRAPSEQTSARQEEGVPASAQSEDSIRPNQTAAVSPTEISCTDEVLKPFWKEIKNTGEFHARPGIWPIHFLPYKYIYTISLSISDATKYLRHDAYVAGVLAETSSEHFVEKDFHMDAAL